MRAARATSFVIVLVAIVSAGTAFAADRHVYLDTNGNGTLNDCPNPAHNVKGTSNTDELQYCNGGSQTGKVIGTVTGTTTSAACTSGGGAVANVTNGVQVDVDRDGTTEFVYGHPQACVWNMARSDSCEIHAGTYRRPGAYADADAFGDGISGGGSGCDKPNCSIITVLAVGYGPNANTGGQIGYGSAAAPGFLRGAVMNGSTDSWDSNGNKRPDVDEGIPSYAAVLTGDLNNNGVFDATACTDSSCAVDGTNGDAFYAYAVGCVGGGYDHCKSSHSDGYHVDTDANGTYETVIAAGAKNVDYLTVKDIEVTRYNGGHTASSAGARSREGHFALEGNSNTNGIVVDHVYLHDNDYSLSASPDENFWVDFSDSHNGGCTKATEIKNSLIFQNNEKVYANEGSQCADLGCPLSFHDNRVVIDVTSSRASNRPVFLAYIKGVDTFGPNFKQAGAPAKAFRIWNNEIILNRAPSSNGWRFLDLQLFGNSVQQGKGELWVYGNLFRKVPSGGTGNVPHFWNGSCSNENTLGSCGGTPGNQSYSNRVYLFNNTFDMSMPSGDGIFTPCQWGGAEDDGELFVAKNNAYWNGTTNLEAHTRTDGAPPTQSGYWVTRVFGDEICSYTPTGDPNCTQPAANARTDWFTYVAPTLYSGVSAYSAKPGGPLDNRTAGTPCDPDGNGSAGVDYNGDGINDTSWLDLAGNTVSCPTPATAIDAGAVQSGSSGPPDTTPPGNVTGVTRTDKH